MKILLVNDDGYNHERIILTEKILKKFGDVYVFAPKTPQSAKSASLSIFFGVDIDKLDDYHYVVSGTPVDCVEAAECLIGKDFDLVVSGCNNGYNLSQDIVYSGTCGACVQANLDGLNAMAFSMDFECNIKNLETMIPVVMNYVKKYNLLTESYYLNVNFPKHISRKIKITKVNNHISEQLFIKSQKGNHYVIERNIQHYEGDEYDVNAVGNGYISITPMSQTMFNEHYFEELKEKVK